MNLREWPLVLFTLLGQAAAGTAVFLFLLPIPAWTEPVGRELRTGGVLLVLILASLASVFSFFHLGRPSRAPRALRNTGGSWLSRELGALLFFLASTAALAFFEGQGLGAASVLGPVAAAAGLAFVFSMARIYTLPAVPDWNSPRTTMAFFSTSLALGAMIAAVAAGSGLAWLGLRGDAVFASRLRIAALPVLGAAWLAAYFFSPRFGRRISKATPMGFRPDPSWPALFLLRMILFSAALTGWAGAVLVPGAAGPLTAAALAAAAASEIIGRFLFYALPLGL